jgi:predicted site-specific integrase-resolvase
MSVQRPEIVVRKIGYARVSTEDQQVDLQLDAEGTSVNDVANIFGGHVSAIYRRFDTSIV